MGDLSGQAGDEVTADRVTIAVINGGDTTFYRSRGGGDDLDLWLFFGPEPALAFHWAQQDAPMADELFLDDEDGAALIDCDGRRLLWFGGLATYTDVQWRAAHARMMAAHWPGWTIAWAAEGLVEIARALGREIPPTRATPTPFLFDRAYYPSLAHMLVTWRGPDGAPQARRMSAGPGAFWQGPEAMRAALDRAADLPSFDALEDGYFDCGADIDFRRRRLAFWAAEAMPHALYNAREAWPGWEIDWLRDDVNAHLAMARGLPPLPPPNRVRLRHEVIEDLRARMPWRRLTRAKELGAMLEACAQGG